MQFILLLFLFALLTGCSSTKIPEVPFPGSPDWMARIDAAVEPRVNNTPDVDIGSHEWMQAISNQLGIYDREGHGPDPGSDEWISAVHYQVFGDQLFDTADQVYISIDGERLAVFYDTDAGTAIIIFAGRKVTLPRSISASGVRFSHDKNDVFWVKGRTGTYWRQGKKIFEGAEECR
ncbi:MAG: MliC family protein [Nitrosomonas sp.]|nr:MliC family protein [Nitrosomonas sp.]